jgi:hypothetical protein
LRRITIEVENQCVLVAFLRSELALCSAVNDSRSDILAALCGVVPAPGIGLKQQQHFV